jgi:hypothetical protein
MERKEGKEMEGCQRQVNKGSPISLDLALLEIYHNSQTTADFAKKFFKDLILKDNLDAYNKNKLFKSLRALGYNPKKFEEDLFKIKRGRQKTKTSYNYF